MYRARFMVLLFVAAPIATVNAQAVDQRSTVGYINSGYSLGYRGFGGYGFGFSNRAWGGGYGDLLYQQPTQYVDYGRPVYRGSDTTAEIAQSMYRAAYDAYGGQLQRTDEWASRVLNARQQFGTPAAAISSAPMNDSLWLTRREQPARQSDAVAEYRPLPSAPTTGSNNTFPPQAIENLPTPQATMATNDNGVTRSELRPIESRQSEITAPSRPTDTSASPAAAGRQVGLPLMDGSLHDSSNPALAAMAVGRGDAAFRRGAYEVAREHYLRACVAMANEAGPHIAHGLACFALGDYSTAARSLRTGVSHAPNLAAGAVDLRDLYGSETDFGQQRAALEKALEARQDAAAVWFVDGFVNHFTNNPSAARDAFMRYRERVAEDLLADEFIDRVLAGQR